MDCMGRESAEARSLQIWLGHRLNFSMLRGRARSVGGGQVLRPDELPQDRRSAQPAAIKSGGTTTSRAKMVTSISITRI